MVGKVGLCRIRTHKVRFVKFCPALRKSLSNGRVVYCWRTSGRDVKTQTLVLIALAAVEGTACYRTSLDSAATNSNACGDTVLEGYLVEGHSCPSQAFSNLPAYRSKDGLSCHVDAYLSEQVPANLAAEGCSGEPFTSQCFLETAGFTENPSDSPIRYTRVSLVGSMQTVQVCKLVRMCTAPECTECQQQAVFVPCQVLPK